MFGCVIMDEMKDRRLDVYCLFRNDGIVLPIRVRMFDEDGERQDFAIHRYKLIDGAGGTCVPKAEVFRHGTVTFDCEIEVFGSRRVVRLLYTASDMRWKLLQVR